LPDQERHRAEITQPPRSLVSPARLNFAKNRKQLGRGDFGYGALPLAG
jgi:hypothetical protein